jgi:DNA-directed RNA polymerase specialized sigma24 family protein
MVPVDDHERLELFEQTVLPHLDSAYNPELPLEFREIVILREMEGFSYKEIAELAEVPIGTVMSRWRARRLLQKNLTASFKPGDQR